MFLGKWSFCRSGLPGAASGCRFEAPGHESDHGPLDHRLGLGGQLLGVPVQAEGEVHQRAGIALPSAQTNTIEGIFILALSGTSPPPSGSCAVTSTTTSRPRVSTTMWRLRQLVLLPAS